jgi:DeoR family transcriptional regulator, suf operon transcriptional repressor
MPPDATYHSALMGARRSELQPAASLPPGHKGPRGAVLVELKRSQLLTARELAVRLGVSLNAVRHHVRELESEGLVEYERRHRGVGAPAFAYRLTAAGEALFPRRYEQVLADLLDHVVAREGRAAAVAVLEARFEALARRLEPEVAGLAPAERMAVVARALTAEGYMAEGQATFCCGTLVEHNCAMHAVAERFPELCLAEERFLAAVLGGTIERRGHIQQGCSACTYKVRFTAAAAAAGERV